MTNVVFDLTALAKELLSQVHTKPGVHAKVIGYEVREDDDEVLNLLIEMQSIGKDGACSIIPNSRCDVYVYWQPHHAVIKLDRTIDFYFVSSSDENYNYLVNYANELCGQYPAYLARMSVFRQSVNDPISGLFTIGLATTPNAALTTLRKELSVPFLSRILTRLCNEAGEICTLLESVILTPEHKHSGSSENVEYEPQRERLH